MTLAPNFQERVGQIQNWLEHSCRSETLRCQVIAPTQTLYDAFKSGTTAEDSLRRQVEVVESVVLRRAAKSRNSDWNLAKEGRLLAVELPASMYDGIASSISGGFFDESDAPPWDLWVKVVEVSGTGYLLSWIPVTSYDAATAGIDCNGGQCIRWLDVDEYSDRGVRVGLSC